jgi:hypothetical protein
MVIQGDDTHTLRQITRFASIVNWAKQKVGDTHIGKRKLNATPRKEKEKKAKVMSPP